MKPAPQAPAQPSESPGGQSSGARVTWSSLVPAWSHCLLLGQDERRKETSVGPGLMFLQRSRELIKVGLSPMNTDRKCPEQVQAHTLWVSLVSWVVAQEYLTCSTHGTEKAGQPIPLTSVHMDMCTYSCVQENSTGLLTQDKEPHVQHIHYIVRIYKHRQIHTRRHTYTYTYLHL